MKASRVRQTVGEFVLIVTGVMAALAGDSWRESRAQGTQEHRFLDRIVEDLEESLEYLEGLKGRMDAVAAHGFAALPYLRGEDHAPHPIGVLGSAYNLSRGEMPTIFGTTYAELTSGPGLGIISDERLRRNIVTLYWNAERSSIDDLVQKDFLAYRNALRSTLPVEIQIVIRSECPLMVEPLSCDAKIDREVAEAALTRLQDNDEVERSGNLWLQSVEQDRARLEGMREGVRQLIDEIEAQ